MFFFFFFFSTISLTARSKSGGIKKGSLSLPIIGPRHQHRVDKIPNKLESRAISPEIELNKSSIRFIT
jgi:hypothetical protein